MERKYYLRGLGLGIVMTAIIMGVALSGNKTMTDEEIIARAKELGMVENTVLSDSDNESDDENTDKADVDSQDDEQQGMTEPEQNLPAETEQDLSEPAEEDSSEQTGQDTLEPAGEDMSVEADSENVPNAETDTEGSDGIENASEEDADMNDTTPDEPEETANEIITSAAVKTITVKSGDGSYTVAPYIFTERNGIHIIDLQKSVGKVDEAYKAVFDVASQGGTILFVGTKKQAQDAVKTEAERCGMYYVNERWLGGMLTNFKTIQSRIERLKAIETMSEDGTFDVLPKKEVIQIKKEWEKLEKNLGGIKNMTRIPDCIFVVDPKKERICVQEAHTLGITLIGIGDTNCDPEELDYIIPGNDDAIRAVKLIVAKMADAVIEANQGAEEYVEEAEAEKIEEADEDNE